MNFLITTVLVMLVFGAAVFWWFKVWQKMSKDRRRLTWMAGQQYTVLQIQVPRNNDKTPLSAEQMFASIHGIYQSMLEFQDHIGFEIVAIEDSIQFYVFTPVRLQDFIEGQIYAQYPTVEIVKVEDYTRSINLAEQHTVATELEMTKPDVYPIKTFVNFNVDPLAGITSTLAKLQRGEQVWIQILARPVDDSWQTKGTTLIESMRRTGVTTNGSIVGGVVGGLATIAVDTVREATSPGSIIPKEGEKKEKKVEAPKLSGPVEAALKGVEEKITKLGFATKIRILAVANDVYSAQSKVSGVVGAFKQFNTTNLNGFTAKQMVADSRELWDQYAARSFEGNGLVLNIEELASVYHLPNITVETPNINWTTAKKGEPPGNLPLIGQVPANDLTLVGKTNFRNVEKEFGIKLGDRRRHIYVIGKSGTGKSTLLENMIIDDIREGRGVIVVDPHGELVEHVMASVPRERIDDVVLFDPSDRSHPVGFNLLETVDEDLKGIVASGFVGIFKKIFGNSWGPRLEHILRNSVLALLDYPGSTMLGIVKMLNDKKYRQMVVAEVKDPVIKDFWETEFAGWDQKFASEAASPILNKVGQFIATSTIRNIVGQPKSTFDVRKIMDEGKILLINLSRGKIGEDNSALLGAMMITKIQLAAMSRADIPESERTDSYLYVDEFQNFATESFATILSEARKYHLDLVMANQYIAQMQDEVREAVFGNVGTIIAFRVGAGDAGQLVQEFTPVFIETDLVNQDIHKIYIKLSIDGLTSPAFSANALPPYKPELTHAEEIVARSREKYSRDRLVVEAEIDQAGRGEEKERLPAHLANIPDGEIELPAIKIRQENVVSGTYYKELNAPGGDKWWEGYTLEEVMEEEEKKRQKFIAKKVEHLKTNTTVGATEKPATLSDTNNSNENEEDLGDLAVEDIAAAYDEPEEMGESEKKSSERGTELGERGQASYSTTIANNSETTSAYSENAEIGENTQKDQSDHSNRHLDNTQPNHDQNRPKPASPLPLPSSESLKRSGQSSVALAEEDDSLEDTSKEDDKDQDKKATPLTHAPLQRTDAPKATIQAQIPPEYVQKPLQSPTKPDLPTSGINARPKPILERFLRQNHEKSAGNGQIIRETVPTDQNEAKSRDTHELTEGEAYTL